MLGRRTNRGIRVTHIQSLEALVGLRMAWNRLAADIPFRSWEWCTSWWLNYATANRSLLVLLVTDDEDTLIGIAPWYLETNLVSGRVIRFLGAGEACPDYTSILSAYGHEQEVARHVADWLSGDGRQEWDLLRLEAIAGDDVSIRLFADAMHDRDHTIERTHLANSWRAELPEDWQSFVSSLSRSPRSKVRKLEKLLAVDSRLQQHEVIDEQSLAYGFQVLIDLHQRRRQSLGQHGCFSSRPFTFFHDTLARQFLAKGTLRLRWTEFEHQPIAVEYGYRGDRTAYYYQGGFAPEAADLNPGWLQFTSSIRSAIEQGCRHYDFLRGDEPYKALWQAIPVPLEELRVIPKHPAARLRHAASELSAAARRAASRLRKPLAPVAVKVPAETPDGSPIESPPARAAENQQLALSLCD